MAVRLLFAGLILCAFLAIVIREVFAEPYPAPFMPAFKGNALEMVSPTEAAVFYPLITIKFSDGSTVNVTQTRLFGDGPSSASRNMIYFIVPDPAKEKVGARSAIHHWVEKLLGKQTDITPTGPVPDDVVAYLQRRTAKLFPSKTSVSMTVTINRGEFPLADFHKMTTTVISQNTIIFHEGA